MACLEQQHSGKEAHAVVVVEDLSISDLDDSSNLDCIYCLKGHNYSAVVGFAAEEVTMATPPRSPPPPPPPPADLSTSPSTMKWTRKATWLRSLAIRQPGAGRLVVNVDPDTGKADDPHKKLRTYLEGYSGCAEKGTGHPKAKHCPHVLSRGGYEYLEQKLMAEKTKKKLEEAAQSGSTDGVIDPSSPIRCYVKWKMARTKKIGQMTSEAIKEIVEKIDSLEEQASQGSFIPHGCQDVLTATIGRPEHPGRVYAAGAGVTIKKYFGSAPRTSCSSSSLPSEDLQQLTQQIRDQLEESITKKGLALPPEPEVAPSGPRVGTKESCVDPSGNDPKMGDSNKCGLYIEANPPHLVALGRLYEGSTVHNIPLLPGQVKVGVEEVKDAQAPVLVPTDEVTLVGQTLNTFLAWPTHLMKALSVQRNYLTMFDQQAVVSPAKPPQRPDPEVDDPLYLMTLTIPELFLQPFQVNWDATMFGVCHPNFPLYIKYEDLSKIAHGSQCLNISVIQLWILPDNYLKGIINRSVLFSIHLH
ncbi:hypothetical protein HKD37_17G048726 [Glycine soja]